MSIKGKTIRKTIIIFDITTNTEAIRFGIYYYQLLLYLPLVSINIQIKCNSLYISVY